MKIRRLIAPIAPLGLALALGACGMFSGGEQQFPQPVPGTDNRYNPSGTQQSSSIFGTDGLSIGGNKPADSGGTGIGVNSLLWRASLDTLSFMPLASADPFGGVIITDWYSAPDTPTERFKATVYILDKSLRADGLKVAVFRQDRQATGWVDVPVSAETTTKLEDAILTRARQLRIAQFGE
jgi:hypothetical protein